LAKYHQIAERILKTIVTGDFKSGDRIPSEKDLAEDFGSSVLTVNKAISILVSKGYLFRKPGLGAFLSDDIDIEQIKSSKQFTVGIIVDSSIASIAYADRVLGRIAFNLQNLLNQENFIWSIISGHDGMDFHDYLDSVDGFITVGDVEAEFVQAVEQQKLPCVTFNRDRTSFGLGSVLINPEAIHQLVDQMVAAGHRRFLYVNNESEKQIYTQRLSEYREALQHHKLSCRHLVVSSSDLSSGNLSPEVREILEDFDFAFLPNDSLAISFLHFLEANEFQVPDHMSICGYDNAVAGRHCSVPLTTIAFDILEACAALVQTLKEQLFQQSSGRTVLVDSWLILRDSTAGSFSEKG
jgi:DNA-binding LacI/PurR family transcriptional regulator